MQAPPSSMTDTTMASIANLWKPPPITIEHLVTTMTIARQITMTQQSQPLNSQSQSLLQQAVTNSWSLGIILSSSQHLMSNNQFFPRTIMSHIPLFAQQSLLFNPYIQQLHGSILQASPLQGSNPHTISTQESNCYSLSAQQLNPYAQQS